MQKLEQLLNQIDRKSYPAYKSLKGSYRFPAYVLEIEHVQGDPFAAPSKLAVKVSGKGAGFPKEIYQEKCGRVMLQDCLLREFYTQAGRFSHKAKGSGKSGVISVSRCGQEVLERTGCEINSKNGDITIRLEVGFPANGRTINAGELRKILFEYLPQCVTKSLFYERLNQKSIQESIALARDQEAIRQELKKRRLIAFVANGAILPRESGVGQKPMRGAVPFLAPKEDTVTLELPHAGKIEGLGISEGITLVVGGGYHGKSTLLKALERGVYNHIKGDGREYVIADGTAMKIRAEDGRSILSTDISPFICNLPNHKDTNAFFTEDASGSTSQAANVIEAMEAGSRVLLIDEDTSATNFMVRDELMQRVVHRDKEPIIPFVERVRELYENFGISTIMVAGSSGSYFHIADTILQMEEYLPRNITKLAKAEASNFPLLTCDIEPMSESKTKRIPGWNRDVRGNQRVKVKVLGTDEVVLNREAVDLRLVEQIVDSEQMVALGYILWYMEDNLFDHQKDLRQCVKEVMHVIDEKGLNGIVKAGTLPGNLAVPRTEEVFACLNRYRGLKIGQRG